MSHLASRTGGAVLGVKNAGDVFQPVRRLAQEGIIGLGRLQSGLQFLAQVKQLRIVMLCQQAVEAITYFAQAFKHFYTPAL